MADYSLKHMDAIVGKQSFDMLVKDGVCIFEEFENNLNPTYKKELGGIYATMDDVANLRTPPGTRYHPYNDAKSEVREYEFKSKHLRVYAIEKPGGKIVIMGGTKANQPKDQSLFRKYKKQYIEYIKSTKL